MGLYTRSDKKEINKDIEQVFEYFPITKERIDQYWFIIWWRAANVMHQSSSYE